MYRLLGGLKAYPGHKARGPIQHVNGLTILIEHALEFISYALVIDVLAHQRAPSTSSHGAKIFYRDVKQRVGAHGDQKCSKRTSFKIKYLRFFMQDI